MWFWLLTAKGKEFLRHTTFIELWFHLPRTSFEVKKKKEKSSGKMTRVIALDITFFLNIAYFHSLRRCHHFFKMAWRNPGIWFLFMHGNVDICRTLIPKLL